MSSHPSPQPPISSVTRDDAEGGRPSRVLVIDDQLQNRRLLQVILERDLHDVLLAEDGPSGLELARRTRPDLVLLDVVMPGMDGFAVCERLLRDPTLSDTPVIFLSALSETSDKVRGLELGAVDYVTKPFDAGEVLARVRSQLAIRRLHASLQEANRALVDKQRELDADLRAAADIQASLLPRRRLASDVLDMAWSFVPCQSIGGDIFDVVVLDARHVAVSMLDVSGHGVPAAMITVSVSQCLNPQGDIVVDRSGRPRDPDEVVRRLDREFPLERFDKYFTIFYGVLDTHTGELRYCNAAHPAPWLVRDDVLEPLETGGTIVGLSGALPFETGRVRMRPGDRVVLYTDGVTEAVSPDGRGFGEERLRELVLATRDEPVRAACDRLADALRAWHGGRQPLDDISILGLEYLGARTRPEQGLPRGG